MGSGVEGSWTEGWSWSVAPMTSAKICAGMEPPVMPSMGVLASLPTQTTAARPGDMPANHASRCALVVPVLPAMSKPGTRARVPVPRRTVPFMSVLRSRSGPGATTRSGGSGVAE